MHSSLATECSVFLCLRESEKEKENGRGTTSRISIILYSCQDTNPFGNKKQGNNAFFLPCVLSLTFMLTITARLSNFKNKAVSKPVWCEVNSLSEREQPVPHKLFSKWRLK